MKNFCFALCIVAIAYANQAFSSEAGMPQLNPKFWTSQMFWLVIIFSILYLIIWKIFLPKITYSIENRKFKMVSDIDEAQKLKESAEKKLKEYNKIIEDSKKEAKKIIEENKKKLEKNIGNKRKNFNDEIEKELMTVEEEIKDLKKSSISKINVIAAEISAEVIKQIINIEVNKSNVSAIVNDITKRKMEKRT